jgi:hypothetical protein
MWSAVEINVGIMCACVPSLKPLVAKVLPKLIKGSGDDITTNLPSSKKTTTVPCTPSSDPRATSTTAPVVHLLPGGSGNAESGSKNSVSGPDSSHQVRQDDFVDLAGFLNCSETPNRDADNSFLPGPSRSLQNITFVDFVKVQRTKSMLEMNNRESILPLAFVTILFFLWGFAYGLLDILNQQFQAIVKVDVWHSLSMHAAYYAGYLIGPITIGRYVLIRWGFKATFMTGLCIYACGTLTFWPSAVLTSFPAYTVSNFVVGFGLAVLETAANPFISMCGPLENAEIRLNVAQGIQAIGSVVSPMLAKRVLFKNVQDAASLVDVQWTYLGIALFDVLLAIGFYYMPLPEASDHDLKELADQRRGINSTRVFGVRVIWLTFGLGAFSQWCYTGAQEAFAENFQPLVQALIPS